MKNDPITEITESGLKTRTREFSDYDIILYATGFDAGTGAIANIDVRGRGNQSVADAWSKSVETYLGIFMHGFPNFYMISGPQAPFANTPMIIEKAVDLIGKSIGALYSSGNQVIEVKEEPCQQWAELIHGVLAATVLADGAELHSWFLGNNISGKLSTPLFHFGGANYYFDDLEKEVEGGFSSMKFAFPREQLQTAVSQ